MPSETPAEPSAVPPAVDSPPPSPRRTWTAGTLTYSAGGLALLFFWLLLGDFAFQLRERSATPVTQVMLRLYDATDLVTSLLLVSLPAGLVFLVGPILSYWSDHHRGRSGRRLPFLFWPTPLVLLSMVGLASSPLLGEWVHAKLGGAPGDSAGAILVSMAVFILIFELVTLVSNTLFNSLINDVVPRPVLGRFFGLFRAVSLGVGILFNYAILGHAEVHYPLILGGIGLVYAIGFTVMCLAVREGEYPPPPPAALRGNLFAKVLGAYYRDCFARPYYRLVLLYMAFAAAVFMPVNTFSLYAARDLGMTLETYGRYLVVTYTTSLFLAYPLGWLADRFHPLRVGLVALASYSLVMAIGFFYLRDVASFGVVFLLHGVLSGAYFTGSAALGQFLFPRLRFAQFAAAGGILASAVAMCLAPIFGQALDLLGRDYRLTFLASSILGAGTFLLGLRLHARFQALGGSKAYQAPE